MRNKFTLALLLAQPFALMAGGVQGSVADSLTNAPIPRAHVMLAGQTNGKETRYGATSAAGGGFAFTGVPAGDYEALADRTGYVDQNGTAEGRVRVHVEDTGSAVGITIKLIPLGSLTGHVTASNGEPVEGAEVAATGSRGGGSAITDETGGFRIGGLAPGKYTIQASHHDFSSLENKPEIRTDGTVEIHDAATWWPGALDKAHAGKAEVKPGAETAGVDIQLTRVPFVRVSGRVVGAPHGAQVALMIDQGNSGMGGPIREDGTFELWRLDPGAYTFSANWQAPNGAQLETVPVAVEVSGSNVDLIELRVVAPSNISGHLEFEDDNVRKPTVPDGSLEEQEGQRIQLSPDNGNTVQSAIGSDGTFQLKDVAARKYSVSVSWGNTYVKSMRLGTTAFDGANLDLSNGSGGAELTVRVAAPKSTISGTVKDGGERAGLAVAIVQHFGDDSSVFSIPVKPDGTWSSPPLPPGRYQIRAVQEKDVESLLAGPMDDDEMETVELGADDQITKDLKAPVQP